MNILTFNFLFLVYLTYDELGLITLRIKSSNLGFWYLSISQIECEPASAPSPGNFLNHSYNKYINEKDCNETDFLEWHSQK